MVTNSILYFRNQFGVSNFTEQPQWSNVSVIDGDGQLALQMKPGYSVMQQMAQSVPTMISAPATPTTTASNCHQKSTERMREDESEYYLPIFKKVLIYF